MSKRLSDSAGTGEKIMQNQNLFKYTHRNSDPAKDKIFHTFDWTFGNQEGSVVIVQNLDGIITQSSTLNCSDFQKSLGAYNDPSLYDVFRMMLDSQKIPHK